MRNLTGNLMNLSEFEAEFAKLGNHFELAKNGRHSLRNFGGDTNKNEVSFAGDIRRFVELVRKSMFRLLTKSIKSYKIKQKI